MDSSNSPARMRRESQSRRGVRKAKASSWRGSFQDDRQHLDRRFIAIERAANLNALNHSVNTFENLSSDEYALITRIFRAFRLSLTHAVQDGIRNRAAGDFVVQKFRGFVIRQRHDCGDDWDFRIPRAVEKALENSGIKDRLCQNKFCPRIDLIEEALRFQIVHGTRICSHANHESGRFSDRFTSHVHAVIQAVDYIRQANGIDLINGGGIAMLADLMRIAG